MPELPEVETTRAGISLHIVGQTLNRLVIRETRFRWPVDKALISRLRGQRLTDVGRRSKYLVFKFEEGVLLIHLGMSGSLRILSEPVKAKKHEHIDWEFSNGKILRFKDPRRFGAVLWAGSDWQNHKLIQHLGPEPLTAAFNKAYLLKKSQHRKQNVKQFIMDANIVVGVGNIYANEVLFKAGIHPLRPTASLSEAELGLLVKNIKQVLKRAIQAGGTTLKDFESPEGKPGYFVQKLSVYGRKGEQCMVCGKTLEEVRLNQRSTVFCTGCQK